MSSIAAQSYFGVQKSQLATLPNAAGANQLANEEQAGSQASGKSLIFTLSLFDCHWEFSQ